jgi:hypothetical protein
LELFIYILFQASLVGASMEGTNYDKVGLVGCALIAVIVLWRKQSQSDMKYAALLERVINIENNSTKSLEENTKAIDKLSEIIEKKLA